MNRPTRNAIGTLFLLSCASAVAQKSAPVEVPSQLRSAKTVFLGYGAVPGAAYARIGRHIAADLYTQTAQAIAATGRLQLVKEPASAELCMVISVPESSKGDSASPVLTLTIRDCKTTAVLWTLEQGVTSLPFTNTDKEIGKAVGKFTESLNALAAGEMPY